MRANYKMQRLFVPDDLAGDAEFDAGQQQSERTKNAVIASRRPPKEIEDEGTGNDRDYRQSPPARIALLIKHRKGDT
jgi:hypothetical protein